MAQLDWKEYLDEVTSYVKFKYDRREIFCELAEHMEDRYEDFLEDGMEEEKAKCATIACMGEAKEVGEELDKEHSPLLGWVYLILKRFCILMVIMTCIPVLNIGLGFANSLFNLMDREYYGDSPLVYTIDIDENFQIYEDTLILKDFRYYEDGTLELSYATWSNPFAKRVFWNASARVLLYDADGNAINTGGGGYKGAGYYSIGSQRVDDVPEDIAFAVVALGETGVKLDLQEGRVYADE